MIQAIPCIHLPVTDVHRSINWWREHFGLKDFETYDPEENMAALEVEEGQKIYLHQVNILQNDNRLAANPRNSDTTQLYSATLHIEKPETMYHKLKAAGVKVGELHQAWGYAFDLYDPDNNKFNVWGGEWEG